LSLAFSRGGAIFAAGTSAGAVELWNVATGRLIASLTGSSGAVWSVAFSPRGTVLAAGYQDGAVRLWDVVTGQEIGSPLYGPAGAVVSVAFSPDGKTLATPLLPKTVAGELRTRGALLPSPPRLGHQTSATSISNSRPPGNMTPSE
jgi:WD40 repeat protein